jgi:hypothetical protein
MLVYDRWSVARGIMGVAPMYQRQDHRIKRVPFFGQSVFMPERAFLIRHLLEHAFVDQMGQTFRQDAPRNAEAFLEFLEPPHTQESIAQDKQRPAIADNRKAAGKGTILFREILPAHHASCH